MQLQHYQEIFQQDKIYLSIKISYTSIIIINKLIVIMISIDNLAIINGEI